MYWPNGLVQPRVIPDEAVYRQVRRVCKRTADDAMMREAAQRIYNWHYPQGEPLNQLQQCLDLIATVQAAVGNSEQVSPANVKFNSLCIAIAYLAAAHLPMSSQIATVGAKTRGIAAELAKRGDADAGWWVAKLNALINRYAVRWKAVQTLRSLGRNELEHWAQLSAGQDIQAMADEIAVGIARLRAYGVKSCVVDDGIMHPVGTVWLFADGYEARNRLSEMTEADLGFWARVMADTALTQTSEVRKATSLAPVAGSQRTDTVAYARVAHPVRSMMECAVQESGYLPIDSEIGVVPVESHFVEAGLRDIYPMFRLVHLLRLYDLVVPIQAMRQSGVPSWPVRPTRRQEREAMDVRRIPFLRSLVVPRLRLLGDKAGLDAAYLREMAEAAILTEQLARKRMGRHEIIGFVRPLPVGRHATGRARELALKELGITQIPEGWTYVKTHERGRGDNPAIGHIARRQRRK